MKIKIPTNLSEASALPNGPIAKFYMLKFASHLIDTLAFSKLGCDDIRKEIAQAKRFLGYHL